MVQSEKWKWKRIKKIEENRRDLWDTSKHISAHIQESQKGKREKGQKEYLKNNSWKLDKSEVHGHTYPRNQTNHKQHKFKEIYTETDYNETVERQRENLVISERGATCHIQNILSVVLSQFLIIKYGGQKAMG